MKHRLHPLALAALSASLLAACGGSDDAPLNSKPAGIGEVRITAFDGAGDDLLTAGLGKSGLQSATPPAYANVLAPTAAELRRAAIYNSYRAIVDMTDAGGYGRFYGPNVSAAGVAGAGEGKIAKIDCKGFEKGGPTTPLEKRASVECKVTQVTPEKPADPAAPAPAPAATTPAPAPGK